MVEGPQVTIRLATLTAVEITALAAAQLQGTPSPALVALLVARAEGNPFFVEQLLRYLQEEEWLTQGPEGWQLHNAEATPVLLPNGARALLVARLDRLPLGVKEVVQTAAVLGREFDTNVLAQMLAADATLSEKLAAADQAAIWSPINQARYLFRHALLREAAYAMQLRSQLRRLHQRAGEAVQSLFAQRLDPYYADLAYHYDRAEVGEQAAMWYGCAGEQAASSYANHDAVHYFSRALALTPTEQAEAHFKLLLGREAVYDVLGQVEAQRSDIARMAELAQQLVDPTCQAQALLRRAIYFRLGGDYEAALAATQQAAEAAEQSFNTQLIVRAHHHWGRVYWVQGNYVQGQHYLEHAVQLARASDYLQGEAECLTDLGSIQFYQGHYTNAEKQYTDALTVYQALGDRKGQVSSLAMLGILASQMADYEAALAYFQTAQESAQAIGYAYGQAVILGNLGLNYSYVGLYAEAQTCLQEAIANCRARQHQIGESIYLDSQAVIHLQLGNYAEAQRTAQQALVIQQAISDRRFEAYSLTYWGDALFHLGDLPAALLAYEQALAIRRQLGEEKLMPEILVGLAQVKQAQGEITEAIRNVAAVLTWIETHGLEGIEFPIRVYLICYQVLLTGGEAEKAQRVLYEGYQLLQTRAAKITNMPMRQSFLAAVPFNHELSALYAQQERVGACTLII